MSLTTTILLLYAACLVGAIASPAAAAPERAPEAAKQPAPRRLPWRAPAVLALPLAALVTAAPAGPARAGEPATRIAALALPAPALPAAAIPVAGPATVIDGATLSVGGKRVRLHGIAAPALDQTCFDAQERGYACGRAAAQALAARIGEGPVACEPRGGDGASARCRLGADDLAAWLVENGYAVADRGVSTDYAAQDERAWGRRRGLWAGVFDLPTQRPNGAVAGL